MLIKAPVRDEVLALAAQRKEEGQGQHAARYEVAVRVHSPKTTKESPWHTSATGLSLCRVLEPFEGFGLHSKAVFLKDGKTRSHLAPFASLAVNSSDLDKGDPGSKKAISQRANGPTVQYEGMVTVAPLRRCGS